MQRSVWGILTAPRHFGRRSWFAATICAALLVVAGAALAFAGRHAEPPRFHVNDAGLLDAEHYPAWQRASDWIAGRHYIMITFDDGPYGRGIDEKILAVLSRHHAHAVFFYVCAHLDRSSPALLRRTIAAGGIIGSHTYDHRHLPGLNDVQLGRQLEQCSARLAQATGARPQLFRPPWGQLSPTAAEHVKRAGMRTVLWDANSGDTWLQSPQEIVQMALDEATLGGHILLMHSRPTTAAALGPLLIELQRRGFRFVLPARASRPRVNTRSNAR